MPLHPAIERVTARIAERSRRLRDDYLARIEAARESGPVGIDLPEIPEGELHDGPRKWWTRQNILLLVFFAAGKSALPQKIHPRRRKGGQI